MVSEKNTCACFAPKKKKRKQKQTWIKSMLRSRGKLLSWKVPTSVDHPVCDASCSSRCPWFLLTFHRCHWFCQKFSSLSFTTTVIKNSGSLRFQSVTLKFCLGCFRSGDFPVLATSHLLLTDSLITAAYRGTRSPAHPANLNTQRIL